jgi:hypothetical protein
LSFVNATQTAILAGYRPNATDRRCDDRRAAAERSVPLDREWLSRDAGRVIVFGHRDELTEK